MEIENIKCFGCGRDDCLYVDVIEKDAFSVECWNCFSRGPQECSRVIAKAAFKRISEAVYKTDKAGAKKNQEK